MSGPAVIGGADWRGAARTMRIVLASLATAGAIRSAAGLPVQFTVLSVVLAITLARKPFTDTRQRVEALIELPVVGLAGGAVAWLVLREQWIGQPLLVVGLSIGIYLRRFGADAKRAGRLITLPFVALLVTPAPHVGGATLGILWAPVAALVPLLWVVAVDLVAGAGRRPGDGPADASRRSTRLLDGPTRMALQMCVGLGVAFAVGHLVFGARWQWTVLSAFIVASGNRGRGDVAHKAGLRVIGALAGTVVASAGAELLPRGNRLELVLLFVVMGLALALRESSYMWWAGGVTAMVTLLHSYYGEGGSSLLGERLAGVLIGSAIGVAAAWFVTPVRSRDVFRRYVADALAALTDDLGEPPGPVPRFDAAVGQLDHISGTWAAHRRVRRHGARLAPTRDTPVDPLPADAIGALHRLDPGAGDADARRRLRWQTVQVRRAMVGKADPDPADLCPELATVHRVLQRVSR